MKLFLASEAKHPDSVKKMEEFVGEFKGKSLAYIPTAANGDGWGSWKEGGSWNLVQTLGTNLTLVQLEDYRNSNIVDVLKGKDLIWMAGGYCGYLMYWIRRTELDKHLKNILESGTIYIGSSAGSMILGQNSDVNEWFIGDNEHGASIIPFLKLVDFDIFPHYEDEMYEEIKKLYKGNKLYLLKNGEEIIVQDKKIEIIGEERIITKK